MIDQKTVSQWLQDYVSAWKSYDPAAIGALFSENASYRFNPYDEPVRGRDQIVANWLENRDDPDTYSASYEPIAITGSTAVANGETLYYQADGKTVTKKFDNIFVLQFDEHGQCVDFCEWYMQPRGQ